MNFISSSLIINLMLKLILIECASVSDYEGVIIYQQLQHLKNYQKSSHEIAANKESANGNKRFNDALIDQKKILKDHDRRTAALTKTSTFKRNRNIHRHKRYTLLSTKWKSTNLIYRFDLKNNKKFVKEVDNIQRISRKAFNVWENNTKLKFTEVKEATADIVMSFEKPKHPQLDRFVFGSQTLAHAFQPGKGLGGDIHFNEEKTWDFNISYDSDEGNFSFFAVMLHAIGHSLGLGHSDDGLAVMNRYYSERYKILSQDDANGLQHIYGIPENGQSSQRRHKATVFPDKCNTPYDAIAMIDNELIVFKGNFMFGPNMNTTEIRSRWQGLSSKLTHVDAVFQIANKKVLFFINQDVYIFDDNRLEKSYKLKYFGIDSSVLNIDFIFKKSDNNQVYIFIGKYYYEFDDHKLNLIGPRHIIIESFKDVYDMETAFTYSDGRTYFFKDQSYYEFDNNNMILERMKPKLSSTFFIKCPNNNFEGQDEVGKEFMDVIDENPSLGEETSSAASLNNSIIDIIFSFLIVNFYFALLTKWNLCSNWEEYSTMYKKTHV
ncbi:hypothetical protein ACKWTF_013421 [Chironomus riparius]